MHSKWQIWDFFNSVQRNYLDNFQGILGLSTFDPISLKLLKDYITRGTTRTIHYKMASEVTKGWIEEEFQTLSLFGNQESFFIHQAQDLNAELMEIISKLDIPDRFLILSFESENAAWKKLLKDSKLSTLTLEPPRFWEPNKLLDFVCSHLRLPLSYEAKSWILEAQENTLSTFYNGCCLIKLNHPDSREVSLAEVQDLLTLERLDQFALASLLARKKFVPFYEKLVGLQGDFDKMRGFFQFMQSHLIKVIDPSYLADKPRLTQYDKDIMNTSKLWKASELVDLVSLFNRWELLSKKKDSLLWYELKEALLRNQTPVA